MNLVIITGRLTKDPELSNLPNGTAVCEFGIATNRKYKKQDGSKGEEVCFVDIVVFGKTAENINKYFKKGFPILVSGRLKQDNWKDKEGKNRSKLRLLVENFEFMESGGKKEEPQASSSDDTVNDIW